MGELLKGLFGTSVSTVGDTIQKVAAIWKVPPEVMLQNQTETLKITTDAANKVLDAATAQIQAVNETMRVEANSPHWLQWAWRPLFGLTGALVIFANYVVRPFIAGLPPMEIPPNVWQVILAVVGVSALSRGGEKIATVLMTGKGK